MRIMQLGNSAAVPYKNGFNVSYIADIGSSYLLIETPPSILNQLNYAGIDVGMIEWVFVSHQHGDHTLGLPMLFLADYVRKSDKIWKIICLKHLEEKIKQVISVVFPELMEPYMDKVKFYHIPDDGVFTAKISINHTLSTAPACHEIPCCALKLDDGNRSFVYSADTAYSEKIVSLAKNTDLLIHEVFGVSNEIEERVKRKHSGIEQAALTAKKSNCGHLLLTHIRDGDPDYIKRFFDLGSVEFQGKITVARDFEWFEI